MLFRSQLAASAVPGLSADQVSVLDASGNLLSRPKPRGDGAEPSEAALEYRKSVERDLQNKIAATLDPLLGPEHFRIGVSAEVDLTSGEVNEEVYDPQKTVMVSSQKSEDGPAGSPATSGVPGTASNVPNATARGASGASTTNYSRRTENVNYQASRVVKHTTLPRGAVLRMSLSVLVDHTLRWEGAKRIVEPPTPEKLRVIRDLVTAATGLSMDRGDQLVVEAFPFESTLTAEPLSAPLAPASPGGPRAFPLPPWLDRLVGQRNIMWVGGIGVGGILLLLGGFVFLLWRSRKKKKIAAQATAALSAGKGKGPNAAEQMEAQLAEHTADRARKEAEALLQLKLPETTTKKTEILTKHIGAEVARNPQGMAHVVRSWLSGEHQR